MRRVAAILNFIADHPGQSFVLTDIVRALKLSRATCHALLTGLVEVGYLYRASDKSYILGPVLARIGRSVAEHFSPLQVAQPEMRRLADQFDVVCSAHVLEGDTVVVSERAASASHVGYTAPAGTRIKVKPQSLAIFYAWSSPAALEARLNALAVAPTPEERANLDLRIAFGQQHGFILLVDLKPLRDGDEFNQTRYSENTDLPVRSTAEVVPNQQYAVASILAPVFDERGHVAFTLGLSGFQNALSGSLVLQTAQTLRQACDRITDFIVGRPPAVLAEENT